MLLLWWAGDYPGLLSPDSVRYVIHVTTGPWTADHSVLYDSWVLLSLKLTRTVALLTLAQTTAASAILAYFVATLRAFGVRQRWAVIPGLVLPLVPSFGAFITTVWKDVPFALCEILVAATTMRILIDRRGARGPVGARRSLLAALAAEFLGLVLFRNDGFLVVVIVTAVLALALGGTRLKVITIGICALIAAFVARSVVYPELGIKPASSSLTYGIFYADIALAYSQAPKTFTASDKAIMTKAAPLSVWRAASNCYSSDPLFANRHFSVSAANKEHGDLLRLWTNVLKRRPVTVIRARICRASVAWNVLPPPRTKARYGMVVVTVPANLYGRARLLPSDVVRNISPHAINSSVSRFVHFVRAASTGPGVFQVAIWRGPTWCYLSYIVLGIAAWRMRRWSVLSIGGISLANQLTVLTVNPAQLYRYMAGPIFVGMLLVPLLAVPRCAGSALPLTEHAHGHAPDHLGAEAGSPTQGSEHTLDTASGIG